MIFKMHAIRDTRFYIAANGLQIVTINSCVYNCSSIIQCVNEYVTLLFTVCPSRYGTVPRQCRFVWIAKLGSSCSDAQSLGTGPRPSDPGKLLKGSKSYFVKSNCAM